MIIDLHRIKVQDVFKGYIDNDELGVTAYDDRLDIRPKYQREFVYNPKQRNAVIDTVQRGFPLNVMYWISNKDNGYELLDGQQRTLSICQYVNGDFSLNDRYFHNLTKEEQKQILDYELMIYFCEGNDKERLEWFEVINTAGEKLTPQELLNAVYTGTWLSDAKLKFSKSNCVAYLLANDGGSLLTGTPIRQEYLETALSWINNGDVAGYMALHQLDSNANELWEYFQNVIAWCRLTFPKYRQEMKTVQWGSLYNDFKHEQLNNVELETEVSKLMLDDDVTKKSGIYPYVLTHNEKWLNIREFSLKERREAYERQGGICIKCNKKFELHEMDADHVKPWIEGGKTTADNCQMLCREDNRRKGKK